MYIRAPGPHSNANRESDLFRNPNQFGFGDGCGDVLVDKGKVVASQLLRQGQRLLHLMIVGSDRAAGLPSRKWISDLGQNVAKPH